MPKPDPGEHGEQHPESEVGQDPQPQGAGNRRRWGYGHGFKITKMSESAVSMLMATGKGLRTLNFELRTSLSLYWEKLL
jgi:hypothetical protein